MKKVIRLTEEELQKLVNKSIRHALKGHGIDVDREIKLAQNELFHMGKNLGTIGLRLDGTQFYSLYRKMADAMIELNNQLIKHIKGEKQ